MNITKQIERIELWSKEKDIPIFETENINLNVIDWDRDSLNDFISIIESVNPRFILFSKLYFQLEIEKEQFNKYFAFINEADIDIVKYLIQTLKVYDQEIVSYNLGFIEGGFICQYTCISDWYEKVIELDEILDKARSSSLENENTVKSSRIIKEAECLARNPLFQKAKNKAQRQYATTIFLESFPNSKVYSVEREELIDMASSIFSLTIEPEQLEKKRKKALAMFEKGIPKTKIIAELNISKNLLYTWID